MSTDDKSTQKDWHELAEQAVKETDHEKLVAIVRELCNALDHRADPPKQDKPVNKKIDTPVDD